MEEEGIILGCGEDLSGFIVLDNIGGQVFVNACIVLIKRKKGVIHTTSSNPFSLCARVTCIFECSLEPSPGLGCNRRVRGIEAYIEYAYYFYININS